MLSIFYFNVGNDLLMFPAFTLVRLQNLFRHLLREWGQIIEVFFEFSSGLSWKKLKWAEEGKERRELCGKNKRRVHQCWVAPVRAVWSPVSNTQLVVLSFSVVAPWPGHQGQGACCMLLTGCPAASTGVHCGPPASTPPLSHFSGSVVLPCCWAWKRPLGLFQVVP